MTDIERWFAERLPAGWFDGAPEISVDRDEILVVGRLAASAADAGSAGAAPAGSAASPSDRIRRFRDDTRAERMRLADEARERFDRTVSWGAESADTRRLFTTQSVPVMTRLRQPERLLLDTLVDAGVARSRSDALAWSVRLVASHEHDWIAKLREALVAVRDAREAGPMADA